MTWISDHNRFGRYRSLRMESLEERRLLSVSPTELQNIRNAYDDFTIQSDVNVIEIEADQISTSTLKAAIAAAEQTSSDDLILLQTTSERNSIDFSKVDDEIIIDTNTETDGIITIIACGSDALTMNAHSLSRIFTVKSGTVQLGNLILTGGKALTDLNGIPATAGAGGAIANAGLLRLSSVTINNNVADCGLFNDNNFQFNSKGGGIYNAGTLFIVDSTISNNIAKSGHVNSDDQAAFGAGGGIFNDTGATLDLRNTKITNNVAEFGIKTVLPEVTTEDEHPVAIKVELLGSGGGIYNFGATMISTNSVVSNNSAWFGGGISSLYNTKPSCITLSDSRLIDNNAHESGGGLYTAPRCSVRILRSFVQGNEAGTHGGGITNRGELSLINSVLSGNRAGTNGGGIYSYGTYNSSVPLYLVSIINSTITGNSSGTTNTGIGGGIYFVGIHRGNRFATLSVSNSIIVNNRIVITSSPNNDVDLYATGTCSGYRSLSTFSDWSNNDDVNYMYDEEIPLFTRDYNFAKNEEGDYRLVFDQESQAIDTGNNDRANLAGLDSASTDIIGQMRFQNDTIDLGAYEYQPTPFDSAFPSRLSVQQGCSINLQCQGSDSNGNTYTNYLVDLDSDGQFDLTGSNFWISWKDLSNQTYDRGYIRLAVENSKGERSETRQIAIGIIKVPPSIQVKQFKFNNDQILKLCLSVFSYGIPIQQWTIDWGDGTVPISYNKLSNSLKTAHYYDGQQTETKTYSITLRIVDSNGSGGDVLYGIGSHTIIGKSESGSEPIETSNDDSEIISFMTETWFDSEKTDTVSSSNLCWAGSSANILYYTGWASEIIPDTDIVSSSFDTEDEVMDYFVEHFSNGSGSVYGSLSRTMGKRWNKEDKNGRVRPFLGFF